jgi:flagellar basal body rod protein FlgB
LQHGGMDAASTVEPEIYEPRTSMEQPDGNDVSLSREIIDSAKNQTLYNAYISMTRGKMRLLNIAAGQAPGG